MQMTTSASKTCNIDFDGVLTRETCASLSVEFICYILYQRQLIPMTYQHLQRELSKTQAEAKLEGAGRIGGLARPTSPRLRRAQQSMGELSLLLDRVRTAFCDSLLPVGKLLLTLGPSPMAPRETYQLCFPADRCSGAFATEAHARSTLFRHLVEHDFIGCFSDAPASTAAPGALTVLVEASRDAGIDWFQPFPAFRLPTRGKLFHVVMANRLGDGDASAVLDGSSSWPNVSGIEPLDAVASASAAAVPEPGQLPTGSGGSSGPLDGDSSLPSSRSSSSAAASGVCMEQELDSHETIWYRSPTTYKGFHHF